MAKKTAPKKKAAPAAKVKAKTVAKPVKAAKSTKASSPVKAKAPKAKKAVVAEKSKPALMTKKGKNQVVPTKTAAKTTAIEVLEVKKTKTVVSMIEETASSPNTDEQKAEKVSKVKPVKVDRGNLNDEKAKWAELFKKYGKEKAYNYKMTESFPSLVPLQHKVLGWGFVLTNENDRLEVLFENGIRMLISNYKT